MIKVGILMGGVSAEREVSLSSGKMIAEHMDKTKYETLPITINKQEDVFSLCKDIDFAFLILHGKFGEDGRVQTILEAMNIPYSGCGPLGSAIAMDKDITKKILRSDNIRTADWLIIKDINNIDDEKLEKIGYPFFVKPNSGGSSVATNLVKNKEELIKAIEEALKYDKEVMVEQYIKGDEITVSVIDGELYPVIAIEPKGDFFCYKSKYDRVDGAKEYVIELDENLNKEVQTMAKNVWNSLKLEGYARVDMIVSNNVPYILEVNTLPGMGPTSLMPQSYMATGHTYQDLVTKIIEISLNLNRN